MIELQYFIEQSKSCATAGSDGTAEIRTLLQQLLNEPRPAWTRPCDDVAEKLLYHDDQVTIFLIQGETLRRFLPHEHGMVAAIALLDGCETHRFFSVGAQEELIPTETSELCSPSVHVFDDSVVHAVEYPRQEPVVAIHVYLGNLVKAPRRMWDHDGKNPVQYQQSLYDRSALNIANVVQRSEQR